MPSQERAIVDELWLIDLDDTLVKKSAMNELLLELCSPEERERLIAHNRERLARRGLDSGAIYNPSNYLNDPEKTLVYFVEQSMGSENYIHSDALNFLSRLPMGKAMIFSFGAEPWQLAKFRALGVSLPIVIIDHSNKTRELGGSFHDGIYKIGDFEAESLVLVDDRAYSFDGFDKLVNVRGIFLDRPEFADAHADDHRSSYQILPDNVMCISSLYEIHI